MTFCHGTVTARYHGGPTLAAELYRKYHGSYPDVMEFHGQTFWPVGECAGCGRLILEPEHIYFPCGNDKIHCINCEIERVHDGEGQIP